MLKLNCIEFTIVSIVHLQKEFFAIAIVSTFVLMGKIFVYRIGGKLMLRSYAPTLHQFSTIHCSSKVKGL